MGDTLDACGRFTDAAALGAVAPKLAQLIKRGLGVNTRVGTARFVAALADRLGSDARPHTGILIKARCVLLLTFGEVKLGFSSVRACVACWFAAPADRLRSHAVLHTGILIKALPAHRCFVNSHPHYVRAKFCIAPYQFHECGLVGSLTQSTCLPASAKACTWLRAQALVGAARGEHSGAVRRAYAVAAAALARQAPEARVAKLVAEAVEIYTEPGAPRGLKLSPNPHSTILVIYAVDVGFIDGLATRPMCASLRVHWHVYSVCVEVVCSD